MAKPKKRLNPKKRTKAPRLREATKYIENNIGYGTIASFDLDSFDYVDEEYDSLEEIFKDMKKRIHYGVEWATKYVYEALGVAVENWYNDYEPVMYVRTETLYDSPDMYVSGYGGHVYINITGNKMEQILENAEYGTHGTTLIISGNEVEDWRRVGDKGIGIWGELIKFLIDGEWSNTNSSGYGELPFIETSQMINFAFEAGIFAKGKAPFGNKKK